VALPGLLPPIVVCVVFIVIGIVGGIGRSYLVNFARVAVTVGVLLFIMNALVQPGEHVLFSIGALHVSTESLTSGALFALTVTTLCAAVVLLFLLVPLKKLTQELESHGVTPKATFVLLAAFQSITSLSAHARVVMDAQKSRGIETEGSAFRRARAFIPVLVPVFLAAMNETEERALALDARAFNARSTHTQIALVKPTGKMQIALAGLAVVAALVAIVGRIVGWF
jgi:energy-coupling factor transporter transmembrane protein EcfT